MGMLLELGGGARPPQNPPNCSDPRLLFVGLGIPTLPVSTQVTSFRFPVYPCRCMPMLCCVVFTDACDGGQSAGAVASWWLLWWVREGTSNKAPPHTIPLHRYTHLLHYPRPPLHPLRHSRMLLLWLYACGSGFSTVTPYGVVHHVVHDCRCSCNLELLLSILYVNLTNYYSNRICSPSRGGSAH